MNDTPAPGIVKALAAAFTDEALASRLDLMSDEPEQFDTATRVALLSEAARRLRRQPEPEAYMLASDARKAFRRVWACTVFRSGYHNGSCCTPSDPHGGDWDCRWVYESTLSEDGFRARFGDAS